jgi:3-deoxy-D-manno-octulosonic-acid transferase
MKRHLYTILLTLSIPVVLLRLLWKSRKIPGYRHRILERFGFFSPPSKKGGLWLHAVSVGESVAAIPIIREFQRNFPEQSITITTTTPTGSERVRAIFGNQVFHVYSPYDLPICIKLFLKRIRPEICVIMETELWPNLLEACGKQKIPVVIANGCLSLKSFEGYKRIKSVTQAMLENITWVAAQSKLDAERFLALGLESKRVVVAGNVKFDIPISENSVEAGHALRQKIGKTRPVWVAASTHPGEEEEVLTAFRQVQKSFQDVLLILVPRHPNRFQTVLTLLQKRAFSVVTRSSDLPVEAKTEVFLGDTMGELGLFYAASDIAFVGGSFTPIGGHNILEAAALAVPVIVGPHIQNIVDTCDLLSSAGALVKVSSTKELGKALLDWFSHGEKRRQAGYMGKKVIEQNRGAVEKIFSLIKKILQK